MHLKVLFGLFEEVYIVKVMIAILKYFYQLKLHFSSVLSRICILVVFTTTFKNVHLFV